MSKTTLWWSQEKQQDEEENENENENDVVLEETNTATQEEEKEAMFEKPLTPSDVGKLNRLVIPKQHAERYFPLDSEEIKGLLLSFEDESGKCWRFRYSYWNSSQSYVLTKGWSRYVKDKRLDAGDVVLFHRHRFCPKRFFISWRRRNNSFSTTPPAHLSDANGNISLGWSTGFYPPHPYPTHHQTVSYHAGGGSQSQSPTTPCGNSSSSSTFRVLRLFGVNVKCQLDNNINDSETLTPECSYNMSLAQGTATPQFYHHRQPSYNSSPNHHMLRQQPY